MLKNELHILQDDIATMFQHDPELDAFLAKHAAFDEWLVAHPAEEG